MLIIGVVIRITMLIQQLACKLIHLMHRCYFDILTEPFTPRVCAELASQHTDIGIILLMIDLIVFTSININDRITVGIIRIILSTSGVNLHQWALYAL